MISRALRQWRLYGNVSDGATVGGGDDDALKWFSSARRRERRIAARALSLLRGDNGVPTKSNG